MLAVFGLDNFVSGKVLISEFPVDQIIKERG